MVLRRANSPKCFKAASLYAFAASKEVMKQPRLINFLFTLIIALQGLFLKWSEAKDTPLNPETLFLCIFRFLAFSEGDAILILSFLQSKPLPLI